MEICTEHYIQDFHYVRITRLLPLCKANELKKKTCPTRGVAGVQNVNLFR